MTLAVCLGWSGLAYGVIGLFALLGAAAIVLAIAEWRSQQRSRS